MSHELKCLAQALEQTTLPQHALNPETGAEWIQTRKAQTLLKISGWECRIQDFQ